jgi:hypothetical protein
MSTQLFMSKKKISTRCLPTQIYSFLKIQISSILRHLVFTLILICVIDVMADDSDLAIITVKETSGFPRELEYVECTLQLPLNSLDSSAIYLVATPKESQDQIACQIIDRLSHSDKDEIFLHIIFPVSIAANESREYLIRYVASPPAVKTDLEIEGSRFDLVVENTFYRADMRKSDKSEPMSHNSGQIRELLIKMEFEQLLNNAEDRLHWAPNFKRKELEYYTTIAHWESPKVYMVNSGPYLIKTRRQDTAPMHPEILLTAVYNFYARLPYFKFFSSMEMVNNVWLELLRNDEMTMDSMFTHLAFQRPDGQIVDVTFADRHKILKENPIENNAPWLCFYNNDLGFAFGSVRIKYDNTDQFGMPSPIYLEHTQIGEWLGGIKYWNRRLIHDHLTYIPKGSRYVEENAYIVFRLPKTDPLKPIKYLANRLRNPLMVDILY